MAGLELWPRTGREGPTQPPMNKKKAGRTKRLRRVNPIEAEDNGETKHCKVRKYLCKVCRQPGHNSRACKKRREQNQRASEHVQETILDEPVQETVLDQPVQDAPDHDEPVHVEQVRNTTQESRVNAPSSQRSTQSDVTQAHLGRPPRSTLVIRPPTNGITIRAPPPRFGSVYEIPFNPPTRTAMRPPTVFFHQGKKIARMKDLTKE